MQPDVSIIIPIHNGSSWINECFEAILSQSALKSLKIQVCVCNDASTDNTNDLLDKWAIIFKENDISFGLYNNTSDKSGGVGYSKNRAVSISNGEYLCFQDIDDVMLPNRILYQYKKAMSMPHNTIVGAMFRREPENSTERYAKWANSLREEQLNMQIYTAHGPTVIMPTWFCHRSVFNKVGAFSEVRKGEPEDLLFFYSHLDLGGKVSRCDECLLVYRYHVAATTFSIHENTIWDVRLKHLEKHVLSGWKSFTIWNAGKQGRKFYNSLAEENRNKVHAFCDVNVKQIGKCYTPFNATTRQVGRSINIIHFSSAEPPLVICVKMDMTNGVFESNLNSLNLREGVDYVFFS